ncbi:hypothetical protein TNCV_222231 [Trichonephila clavipes]|nr:hypothetical protein TNCV_222231 [Trichonephila clavipes]
MYAVCTNILPVERVPSEEESDLRAHKRKSTIKKNLKVESEEFHLKAQEEDDNIQTLKSLLEKQESEEFFERNGTL